MYNVSDKFKEHVKNNGYIEKKAKSAKEPVAKLKWSDFELEPLKPNLIKNGWDDFEPYGSGKNYVENWNFEDDDMSMWNNREKNENNTVTIIRNWSLFQDIELEAGTKYICRIKVESEESTTMFLDLYLDSGEIERVFAKNNFDGVDVAEFNFESNQKINRIAFVANRTDRPIDIHWIQITPIDNQHLVVEKTPLGNELTRIQTWGGTSDIKLKTPEISNNIEANSNVVYSLYIENNGKEELRFLNNWAIAGEPYPEGAEYMITVPPNYKGIAYLKGVKKDSALELNVRSSNNLDFIASDPQIIEGNEPNPVLIVDDLGNGKSKVRVFGANENTKLVHRGTKGIKGEPYTVKTNIDNKGNQLQLDTNLDEQSETIKKGNNDVKLEGKLKDNNIEIKLGRG